jgi:hypothetical protein
MICFNGFWDFFLTMFISLMLADVIVLLTKWLYKKVRLFLRRMWRAYCRGSSSPGMYDD